MSTDALAASSLERYVCPACKHPLRNQHGMLRCSGCFQAYPIAHGIPDFIREDLAGSTDAVLRRMTGIDRIAPLYESRLWYPVVLRVFGGFAAPSLAQLKRTVSHRVASRARVLDVACGPGTFGRGLASSETAVFGVDVAPRMLRQGAAYVAAEGLTNVHFARARVEALPFGDGFFDAALCCGSLHLFADPAVALREIGRAMQPDAVLAGFTFGAGSGGVLRFRSVREWYRTRYGLHVFEPAGLNAHMNAAGFTRFESELRGSILTFSAQRR